MERSTLDISRLFRGRKLKLKIVDSSVLAKEDSIPAKEFPTTSNQISFRECEYWSRLRDSTGLVISRSSNSNDPQELAARLKKPVPGISAVLIDPAIEYWESMKSKHSKIRIPSRDDSTKTSLSISPIFVVSNEVPTDEDDDGSDYFRRMLVRAVKKFEREKIDTAARVAQERSVKEGELEDTIHLLKSMARDSSLELDGKLDDLENLCTTLATKVTSSGDDLVFLTESVISLRGKNHKRRVEGMVIENMPKRRRVV